MGITRGLKPAKVFEYFEKICSIPHGSKNEKALSDYCVEFAKERGLKYYQDELYNVIIVKEASKGCENRPAVIIQGHLDMVCEKESDSTVDFEKDGISLEITDGYLHADKTTLGGDDGIAVAYALAILDSDSIVHPKLEVVLTVCEELGMEGASGIDISMLEGRMLLNIDSEEEGCLLTSCAGGCHVTCRLPVHYEELKSGKTFRIDINGLTGGHSGCEIHKCRANADILAGRLLLFLRDRGFDFRIADIRGGRKDNAIPVDSSFTINVCGTKEINTAIDDFTDIIKREYKTSDPDIILHITEISETPDESGDFKVLDKLSTDAVVNIINSLPNGIIAMSSDMPGMVETSLNLGVIDMDKDRVVMHYLLRSSKDSSLDYLAARMQCISSLLGAEAEISAQYPAWEYVPDSKLRAVMIEAYKDIYKEQPRVESIHAGVECGLLSAKIKGLDCVSFGPDILDIHTPRERLDIASVQRTWEYLLEVLKRL